MQGTTISSHQNNKLSDEIEDIQSATIGPSSEWTAPPTVDVVKSGASTADVYMTKNSGRGVKCIQLIVPFSLGRLRKHNWGYMGMLCICISIFCFNPVAKSPARVTFKPTSEHRTTSSGISRAQKSIGNINKPEIGPNYTQQIRSTST